MSDVNKLSGPLIGIAWLMHGGAPKYPYYAAAVRAGGGIPVPLPQIMSRDLRYDEHDMLVRDMMDENGSLQAQYAQKIKAPDFAHTNLSIAMKDIDGVFFPGGQDISPTLLRNPQPLCNHDEALDATRDVSDYLLMAYCLQKNIPLLAVCRGEEMLGIVEGCDYVQDLADEYAACHHPYCFVHRPSADDPVQEHTRHAVKPIVKDSLFAHAVGDEILDNVASWHHQAIRSTSNTRLRVTAISCGDEMPIIEAVEDPSRKFCLGVQFHPENDIGKQLVDGKPSKCNIEKCIGLFRALVQAAE